MALDRKPSKASKNRTIKVRTVDPNRSTLFLYKNVLRDQILYFFEIFLLFFRYVQNHCFWAIQK